MQNKMTWEEMKKTYPDEWLLIVDCEHDASGHLISGVVARHSKDDQEVFRLPSLNKSCAFKYTGECQFPGGLRAHAEHNHF
ncbi:MAG: hypothetical protein A2W61_08670 [Deltaproteobacteria bacterium RIFCSPLOWO2_01_44_7]|nr:MAG: hypothetical protein A2712_08370 [Deltaproteobacteria bacterium RIFCSPHIGHO2_01_FULL_43_49]OGQ14648.1 MAG: hypothetical protein A3D22_08630 [Deltaproteobacteria bacterium RIFCSPHIGHO2_02_FULL_44_53]OGQ28034.1 MAG: hypothetical protein A3D98_07340 [Deltaproteobacteria bacterium RIFCSPHIGHO2_12_FULL_44_21]OGQ31246.1 MAG: hypothetical protein A2979_07390 [Deltaproteobacteria bacterium RIFCSPLOWO2_01_FULL_45_74]OGQ41487.1 MAG: hypothetical protein A2W61_08670 [Deltaproteobacteria bacterium 